MYLNLVKVFLPMTLAFTFGILITPVATHFFYKYRMWKRYSRSASVGATDFSRIHNETEELKTPRVGGMIIWVSVLITTLLFYLAEAVFPSDLTSRLNFLSRNQTLIPLFTLILGSLIGLWDDFIQIYGNGAFARDDAAWRKWKAFLIAVLSLFVGTWFFYKLGMTSIHIPFNGELYIGMLLIPLFMIVALGTFSGGVIDGLDGLSGGVLAAIFGAYTAIAFTHNQIDLAAYSGVITGAILAFLWFNIPPARFYMGETGIMGLTLTLAALAFLTDSVLILPIIAMPLVITSLSDIIQMTSKKLRNGKRVFRVAPIHHHFEAIGWPAYKVTMRFWVLAIIFAVVGIIVSLIS